MIFILAWRCRGRFKPNCAGLLSCYSDESKQLARYLRKLTNIDGESGNCFLFWCYEDRISFECWLWTATLCRKLWPRHLVRQLPTVFGRLSPARRRGLYKSSGKRREGRGRSVNSAVFPGFVSFSCLLRHSESFLENSKWKSHGLYFRRQN